MEMLRHTVSEAQRLDLGVDITTGTGWCFGGPATSDEEANVLEVEVTNVSANRIRDLDRRSVNWKNFHDINFVNQDYRPFDASNWPLYDSGLLGPVTMTAMEKSWPASTPAK